VDDPTAEVPVELLLEELRAGFADTLRLRRAAEDPASLREVDGILERLN
jgi:hypothetical protein